MLKDIVQQYFQSSIERGVGFSQIYGPELVVLGEAGLDVVAGIGGVDVGARAAPIAGVQAVGFAEKLREGLMPAQTYTEDRAEGNGYFFDSWDKGSIRRQRQISESKLRSSKTAVQRTDVVALRQRDLFVNDLLRPKITGCAGLIDTGEREVGVDPVRGFVPVTHRPFALLKD